MKYLSIFLLSSVFLLTSCTSAISNARKERPAEIGAIAESSKWLAKVITEKIPSDTKEKKILEIGAGTGVFTEKIIEKMNPTDMLDTIELVPELCDILKEKFGKNPQVNVICKNILEFTPDYTYDYVVMGLPFNSFPASLVSQIKDHTIKLCKPDTELSFFEYKWLPTLRLLFMNKEDKKNYLETRKEIDDFIKKYEKSNKSVYLNIPPAVVHFLQIKK